MTTGPRPPAPPRAGAEPDAALASAARASLDDLQGAAPDLGWPEATGLVDGLVDTLGHLLVDVSRGQARPTEVPMVVGAIGGADRPPDHASCRAAASTLRRATAVLEEHPTGWAGSGREVALDLADLLEHTADLSRRGRLTIAHKGVVLRRLHEMRRRLGETLTVPD